MEATPDQWSQLFRVLGSLAVVLAIIFALAYVAKRYFNNQNWAKSFNQIRVIQSMPLGMKSKLMLVEVEDKKILLGVAQQQIQSLSEWKVEKQDA